MSEFKKFHYNSLEELKAEIAELGVDIPVTEDISPLFKKVKINNTYAPNAFAILPMEGCDSNPDGSPSELVKRRYLRYAKGGAGLIWFEACAVVREGKANPLQMMLTKENVGAFKELVSEVDKAAMEKFGHKPVKVLQLTHSGRYSKPDGYPKPIIGQRDPLLDEGAHVTSDNDIITDEELDKLIDKYVEAAVLAKEAGFDGVDIKSCHRYLLSEILACHTRPGKYGGSFENRTRLLMTIIDKVKKATGEDFIIACRFSVYDAHPYPYGFGVVAEENSSEPSMEEPIMLAKKLVEAGVHLLSCSLGNVYFKYPFLTRPMDQNTIGGLPPYESALESIERLTNYTKQIQEAVGDVPVVGNGYSWLRQYIPNVGAANIARGAVTLIGLGRQSFAYPDLVADLINNGQMDPKKCCITCSKCTQIMRDGGTTGCVVKDSEVYMPIYKKYREEAEKRRS